MIGAVSTSETSVSICKTTLHNIPEDSHLHKHKLSHDVITDVWCEMKIQIRSGHRLITFRLPSASNRFDYKTELSSFMFFEFRISKFIKKDSDFIGNAKWLKLSVNTHRNMHFPINKLQLLLFSEIVYIPTTYVKNFHPVSEFWFPHSVLLLKPPREQNYLDWIMGILDHRLIKQYIHMRFQVLTATIMKSTSSGMLRRVVW
jgi:hypothetical protein